MTGMPIRAQAARSDSVMLQKCLANLILNCESLIEFLISNGKELSSIVYEYEKKKYLLRVAMLVVHPHCRV